MKHSKKIFLLSSFLILTVTLPLVAHTNISNSLARNMLNSNDDIILADARELSEYCDGHIIGAVNYPWNSNYFQNHYTDFPQTSTILIICRSGTRSNNAANFLDSKGYTNVFDILNGMNSWPYEKINCQPEIGTSNNDILHRLEIKQTLKIGYSIRDIVVDGYSAPSLADWNNDGKKDLIIGHGSGSFPNAKVLIYQNISTNNNPAFDSPFYAQSNGQDLTCPASGDFGCSPLVTYFNYEYPNKKDIIIGQADGTIKIYYNIGTDENPTFDTGKLLKADTNGDITIDVGEKATPTLVDWNSDGHDDIVCGALDGKIHIFLNCNCEGDEPQFKGSPAQGFLAQENGSDLVVPQLCSSPIVADFDGDGKKDIITGNSAGQLLFYKNIATDAAPAFSGYTILKSNGTEIDLPQTARSRLALCYLDTDLWPDILVGAADGKIHLFQGLPYSQDQNNDGNIDFLDLARFAQNWLKTDCDYCHGADITDDGKVDLQDLKLLADNWLVNHSYKFYDFSLNTNPNWTTQGQWQFGQPSGQGGSQNPYPNYPDPSSGSTGINVYGVNLSGDYSTSQQGPFYLTAGPFDCSNHQNIALKFARWLNTDYSYYTKATIEISNNSTDWNTVWTHDIPGGITDSSWQLMEYNISEFADNQPAVYIRWGYQINPGAYPFSGWNIDDIQLWDLP